MTDNQKLILGGAAIIGVAVGIKVFRDKSNANAALKIKKAVGLADGSNGYGCGLADADGKLVAESTEVNAALKSVGAPFYSLCGRKGLTFRKHGVSCNNEENIYYVSEKVVNNWLKKNKNTSLSELVKSGGDSAKNVEIPHKKPQKHIKTTEIKTKKTKSATKATPKSDKVTIVYGDSMELEASAETHAAKYGIIELSDLIASHNWNNYSKNDKYPAGCQERQYHDNKQLQANVEMRAQNFKPTHLINEDLTAESGPSIINPDGVVLGGNSRVMILNRVKAHNSSGWKAYQEKLYSRAANFGFDSDKLDMFENPVLVRVVSVNMDRCSHYSWVFNTSTKNDTDASDRAITLAKDISDKTIYELSQVIDEAEVETFSQMYEDKSVSRKIEKILSDSGVINSSNHTAWIKDGSFTATAKIMIESILIGTILNDKKLVESAKNYTANIIRSISAILKIRSFPEPWNLIKDFEAAIKLEESRRSSKQPKGDFIKQAGMFGDKPTERQLLVWELLDLKPTGFKKAAKDYARIATNQLNSDDAFFAKVNVTPIEALKKVLDKADGLGDKSRKRRKHGRK